MSVAVQAAFDTMSVAIQAAFDTVTKLATPRSYSHPVFKAFVGFGSIKVPEHASLWDSWQPTREL